MSGDQIGTAIGVAFGCAWGIAGGFALPSIWRMFVLIGSIIVSGILILLITQARPVVDGRFDGTIYGIAVTAEVIAIVLAGVILSRIGSSFTPPAVAAIVGLHFVGLWLATNNVTFVWLAATLCAIAFIAVFVSQPSRLAVVGIGAALALWGAALSTLLKA